MIPDELTADDVESALEEIRRRGVPALRRSRDWCLVDSDGRHFPPKYVVSIACRRLLAGEELPFHQFNGGEQTNSVLRRLGYDVISHQCG